MTLLDSTTTPYPSRTEHEPEPTLRREPVVWGDAAGPFAAEELERYAARGFVQLDALLTADELLDIEAALRSIVADAALADDPRLVREPTSAEVRSIFEVHALHPLLARFAADARLVDRARQLLGSDVYLHQTRANLKPGLRGEEFYWHSDFETWHHEDGLPAMRTVSASIALSENRIDNGSLMIMPGSHLTFVGCAGPTPAAHHEKSLRRQEIGTPSDTALRRLTAAHGIATITGQAGSAVLFDSNCMHGSNGNITPYPRRNLFFVYNSVDNAPGPPISAAAPRPSYIAARTVTPLL
jgi:ectoine hydroxylase